MPDAIVIGAGPNGLVAANRLADAGWSVDVLEASSTPGGAVRTEELTEPGFRHDVFSAFYPLAAASPAIRSLELERHGLEWCHGPLVLAHPLPDGRCAVISRDLDETAAALDTFAAGDGDAWRELYRLWRRIEPHILRAMVTPTPAVRGTLGLLRELGGPKALLRLARLGVLPVRRFAAEQFDGDGAALLLAGNALHADFTPDTTLGGFFGLVLCGLGQHVGYPFPRGGAGELTGALVERLESRGGRVTCNAYVDRVIVRDRRAVGVHVRDGGDVSASRAVLADVDAPRLYLELVGADHLPSELVADLRRFQWDWATIKVDWALDGPIPWAAGDARRAPVIHVADSVDELTQTTAELHRGLIPEQPFLVLGQYSMGDATRAPAGKETAWAYTHVSQRDRHESELPEVVEKIERRIEELAPGFRALVRERHVLGPSGLEERNPNLHGGAVNGGTAQLHQQLVFRPTPGLGRPETPIRGLYLASASAHPGGGVHGACGAIAARAALRRGIAAVSRR